MKSVCKVLFATLALLCPLPFMKAGDIKSHLSVRPSVHQKNLNLAHIFWSINDRALISGMHYPCEKPFHLAPCYDLDLNFDLLQGQSCCRAGDHNSPNWLVLSKAWNMIHQFIQSCFFKKGQCFTCTCTLWSFQSSPPPPILRWPQVHHQNLAPPHHSHLVSHLTL